MTSQKNKERLFGRDMQETTSLSLDRLVSISYSLRRGTKRIEEELPDYQLIKEALIDLDELRLGQSDFIKGIVTAHELAARTITRHLEESKKDQRYSPEFDPTPLFISAYGSFARNDPINKEEDIDLNVFIQRKPNNNSDLRRLYKETRTICRDSLGEITTVTPKMDERIHAPNFFDLGEVYGFINYASVFEGIVQYLDKSEEEILRLMQDMSKGLQKKIDRILEGRHTSANLYPILTSPVMPFQMIAYPETLVNRNPKIFAEFSTALDTLLVLDPIFRYDMSNWLCSELNFAVGRMNSAKGYRRASGKSRDDVVRTGNCTIFNTIKDAVESFRDKREYN